MRTVATKITNIYVTIGPVSDELHCSQPIGRYTMGTDVGYASGTDRFFQGLCDICSRASIDYVETYCLTVIGVNSSLFATDSYFELIRRLSGQPNGYKRTLSYNIYTYMYAVVLNDSSGK